MPKQIPCYLTGTVIVAMLLVLPGCSTGTEEQAREKGSIEKMTDRAAESAVKKIRTPQDKARAAQNLGTDRLEEMDRTVQQQR